MMGGKCGLSKSCKQGSYLDGYVYSHCLSLQIEIKLGFLSLDRTVLSMTWLYCAVRLNICIYRALCLDSSTIRDFPDCATFREKGAKLGCADKLGVFLSLTLCNKANFDPFQ